MLVIPSPISFRKSKSSELALVRPCDPRSNVRRALRATTRRSTTTRLVGTNRPTKSRDNSGKEGVVRSSEDAESGPQHRLQTMNQGVHRMITGHALGPQP
eukprot:5039057-Pyramimonas_sp.AAC.1